MANPNPPVTAINGNILITVLSADISANTNVETIQGFLLSGSLTTDVGTGAIIGKVGSNITGDVLATTPNGQYNNILTVTSGSGQNMFVNVLICFFVKII